MGFKSTGWLQIPRHSSSDFPLLLVEDSTTPESKMKNRFHLARLTSVLGLRAAGRLSSQNQQHRGRGCGVLLSLLLVLNSAINPPAIGATFITTGALSTARAGHTVTLLRNGTVLVTGGYDGTDRLATCDLYNPTTGIWTPAASLSIVRTRHTATLLPNGKVLAASGSIADGGIRTLTCELYDPAVGTWTNTGSILAGRGGHTAILLPNGKVLVAGGDAGAGLKPISSAELYDPAAQTWAPTDSLTTPRNNHTATLLLNGKVLVVGGSSDGSVVILSTAELYDPTTGRWTATAPMTSARANHTATLLPDGRVLVAGGQDGSSMLSSAELYDPSTGTWQATDAMAETRANHSTALLADGRVLVSGGITGGFTTSAVMLSGAELYDPALGKWTAAGTLNTAREFHTSTLLADGEVLIVGGGDDSGNVSSAELYDSGPGLVTLVHPATSPGGGFQFTFTGLPNVTNTVLTTTNPAGPATKWTELGVVPEFVSGLYLFQDAQVANSPQRFYRIRSP
jgi:WD40 repeat protein